MSGLPTDSSYLSDLDTSLMIEQYGGGVESQFAKSSFMREYANIRPIRQTDTIVNNRVGKTTLQKVTPGVRPDPVATAFGKVSLTVDTLVLARDVRSLLNEFQTHFDARMALAEDHGKTIGVFFDQAFIIQGIKGALASAPSGLNSAIGAGKNVTLSSAGDELDPDKLYDAIASLIVQMQDEDIDTDEMVIIVRPDQYKVLLDNSKLLNSLYSNDNGDVSKAIIRTLMGVKIVSAGKNRMPNTAITGHILSNSNNGNAYDVSSTEAKAVAVLLHPRSLLAGETIPLTSRVFYNETELVWIIDSYLSFGVTVNRPDCCGAVFTA